MRKLEVHWGAEFTIDLAGNFFLSMNESSAHKQFWVQKLVMREENKNLVSVRSPEHEVRWSKEPTISSIFNREYSK